MALRHDDSTIHIVVVIMIMIMVVIISNPVPYYPPHFQIPSDATSHNTLLGFTAGHA